MSGCNRCVPVLGAPDGVCELDRHIRMLSSSCHDSCDSEVEFDMHITIEAGLACTLF